MSKSRYGEWESRGEFDRGASWVESLERMIVDAGWESTGSSDPS